MTKDKVNDKLLSLLGHENFVKLWWGLELPGLGKARPNDVWEQDPQRIVDYVNNYEAA